MLQDAQLWDSLECLHPVSGGLWQFRRRARKALAAILLGGGQEIHKFKGALMPLPWGQL